MTKDGTHRSLVAEPRELTFGTPKANLLTGGKSKSKYGDDDDDDDGNNNGDDDGDDDSGGIDDCERPAYQCYYRKFYPGTTQCRSQRKCKANTVGFCARNRS